MTPIAIGNLTPSQPSPDVGAATPEQKKAARDFEAIFLRQLLSSLEKGSGLSGGEGSGGAVFRSMMVGALADSAAEGGGIGLSEVILKAMLPPAAQGRPDLSHQSSTGSSGAALTGPALTGRASTGQTLTGQALTEGHTRASHPSTSQSVDPSRSARLGAPPGVLTEARPATMLGGTVRAQPGAIILPGRGP